LVLAAFPLLAAAITRDPVAVSGITVATGLPWLLFGPIAGAVVDRFDRRRLMVMIDIGRAFVLALFALMVISDSGSLWSLYVIVFLIAVGETVVDTSAQSLLPALVPRDRLDYANGRLFSTMTIANRFVGPPLGGFLFGIAVVAPVAADAASFLIAAVIMLSLSGRFRAESTDTENIDRIMASVVEGMKWLWRNKPIRTFAIGAAILNIGIVAGEAILVLFAREQLGLSGAGFGALFAATAAGYTAGSALAPMLTSRFDRFRIVVSSVAAISASLLAIGVATHWLAAAGGLLIIGAASGLWDVIAVSYRQAAVPDRLRGRTMAAYRVIAHGSIPVGAFVGGVSAQIGGNPASFLTGSAIVLVTLPILFANFRGLDLNPSLAGI
jgi:MFS family permease